MSKQANPKVIGGFVMGAVILSVAAVLVFGSGQLLSEKVEFVLFFEGSLAGLNVGSPVLFRGVKIGSVSDVVVRHDMRDHTITLPVYIELEPDRVEIFGDTDKPRDPLGVMQLLVQRGLRAQLATSSFVTGQRVVEFEDHPEEPIKLTGNDPRYPELPTMASPFAKLAKTIQNLPIEPLANDIRHTVQGIDELVRAPEIMKTIRDLDETVLALQELARNVNSRIEPLAVSLHETADAAQAALNQAKESVASVEGRLNEALGEVQQLAKNVDERIGPLATSLQDTLEVARGALKQGQGTLASIQTVVAEDSPLYHQVSDALGELSAALESVRVLAEYLQQHPEAVFSGKTSTGGQ